MDNNNIFDLAMGLSMASLFSKTMGNIMETSMKNQMAGSIGEPHIFALVNGQKCGPYRTEEISSFLESGQMDGETYIWKAGMTDWKQIKDIVVPKK